MRLPLYCDTAPRLPLPRPQIAASSSSPDTLPELRPARVHSFDALLHEVNPAAAHVDGPCLRALASWLMTLPEQEADAVLEPVLARVGDLGTMLVDSDWDLDPGLRTRAERVLAYVERDDDLIPDRTPVIGLLDDALLLDLAWPAFAREVENYLDFCEFRRAGHLDGVDPSHRQQWLDERGLEAAWWNYQMQVRGMHFIDVTPPDRLFRVC